MKIVADIDIPDVQTYFADCGELILKPGRKISAEDVRDADMLLVRSVTRVDAALLQGSSVRFVGSVTAGLDHIDVDGLHAAGVHVSAAAGFNAPPVSDYVVSVVAALQKKGILKTSGMKVAVIGVGQVGRLVVERLRQLQMDVVCCDPLRADNESDFVSVPLAQMAEVDLICLHVPLTISGLYPTHHFIDAAFLARQKKGAVLLNAARGAVIDTQQLLQHGQHLHWCFDVWEGEPEINKKVLERATLATPHIAGYSVQSKIRGTEQIYAAACAQQIIQPRTSQRMNLPRQLLTFASEVLSWQACVLGVFNPSVLTEVMRATLLPSMQVSNDFDRLRQQFNYRHELGCTEMVVGALAGDDQAVLRGLGVDRLILS